MFDFIDISPAEAKQLISERSNLVILDNRDLQSYKQGHIDGAMMAHDGIVESIINKGNKQVPVLVYCYQGLTSKDVAKVFASCGFPEVYTMSGGYAEWKRVHG